MKKRFLALILALAMCLPLALAVSADEAGGVAATVLNFGYNMTNAEGCTDITITLYTGSEDIREVTSADIQTHKPYYILSDANGNTVKKENITSATFSLHLTTRANTLSRSTIQPERDRADPPSSTETTSSTTRRSP